MKGKKKVALLLLAAVIAAGLGWVLLNYHIVGFRLYDKDAQALDLRGEEISVANYEKLQEKMPGIPIRWDVPFQGGLVADDAWELTVKTLSDGDVAVLKHLSALETVHAEECTDYPQLMVLQAQCPKVRVNYQVGIGGEIFRQSATRVEAEGITQAEFELLQYLPRLQAVVVRGGEEADLKALQQYCHEQDLDFYVRAGGTLIPESAKTVEVAGIRDSELVLLGLLEDLKSLYLRNPEAEPEKVFALEAQYPKVSISWEVELGSKRFGVEDTVIDLSQEVIEDLEEVERRMEYLPNAETLIFGLCGIDDPAWGNSKAKDIVESPIENEDLAKYRDRVRDKYKVVWSVRLGPGIALRTDKDNFMPGHFGVGRLFNDHAYNLRYCEDMVCLDVGHMTLSDISFVEFMPHLKYLILAWTEVQYIEPIRHCKELVFLELDNSCIRDYSPLVDCTALEDLNIGNTYCDITPILEMTWLKNLNMIFCNGAYAWRASQALPDTRVVASGNVTVGGNWRKLPNYYDMRDCLGMYYMD